jgi:hypothetical protein
MMMKTIRTASFALMVIVNAAVPAPHAAEAAGRKNARVNVVDQRTLLRTFPVFRTPAVISKSGESVPPFVPRMHRGELIKQPISRYQSPLPEEAWQSVEFDDAAWARQRAPLEKDRGQMSGKRLGALHAATPNSMICARAKFLVPDLAKAGDLQLSLRYVGGVVAYLNGKELTRRHLPGGELKPDTLAEKYPDDLYVTADGKCLLDIPNRQNEDEKARFQKRYRSLRRLVIPASKLRKGLNVLALQLFRAPVNEAATLVTRRQYSGMSRVPGLWAYVALTDLTLTAPAGTAVKPNVDRPSGTHVWNCVRYDTISVNSYGDPGDAPGPIQIAAARNGSFSGRFVISSDATVEDLDVSISALKLDGGAELPRDAVRLRHGRRSLPAETSRSEHLYDAVLDGVPDRIPLFKKQVRLAYRRSLDCDGAVLPVWVTVEVPKDASPGLYRGAVTVRAKGLNETVLPVLCHVYGWTLPDPIDYRVRQLNIFSPYSLALHYKVPYWSDKHLKLIEKSFKLMAAINARRVDIDLVPVIRARSAALEHSMLRLVPKRDGDGYEYDFSIIEKVMDLVARTMRKPLPLQVNCWGDDRKRDKNKKLARSWAVSNAHVPLLDPKTGRVSSIPNPPPGTQENYRFWKPILGELRKRIEKRGWWKETALGHQSYCWQPAPEQVDVARRIWPDGAWSFSAHSGTLNGVFKGTKGAAMRVPYSECVWTQGRLEPRGYRRLLKPGRAESIWNSSSRNGHHDDSGLFTLLLKPEEMILRGHDGLGYMCVDFLPIEQKKGRYYLLNSKVGNVLGNSTRSFLAAGPDGPAPTGRYEMFRDAVQLCEAVVYLQRALDAKKVQGDLAKRVNAYLDERSQRFVKGWHVNRPSLDRELLALAAEVEAAIGGKR